MKLTDFPPERCAGLLSQIFERYKSARERWPDHLGIKTETNLSIDEARYIYAAGQWLKRYADWRDEAERSKGSIGVYPAEHDISQCAKLMSEAAAKFDKEEPIFVLTGKEMRVVQSAVKHLDHYALMMSFKSDKPKGKWRK